MADPPDILPADDQDENKNQLPASDTSTTQSVNGSVMEGENQIIDDDAPSTNSKPNTKKKSKKKKKKKMDEQKEKEQKEKEQKEKEQKEQQEKEEQEEKERKEREEREEKEAEEKSAAVEGESEEAREKRRAEKKAKRAKEREERDRVEKEKREKREKEQAEKKAKEDKEKQEKEKKAKAEEFYKKQKERVKEKKEKEAKQRAELYKKRQEELREKREAEKEKKEKERKERKEKEEKEKAEKAEKEQKEKEEKEKLEKEQAEKEQKEKEEKEKADAAAAAAKASAAEPTGYKDRFLKWSSKAAANMTEAINTNYPIASGTMSNFMERIKTRSEKKSTVKLRQGEDCFPVNESMKTSCIEDDDKVDGHQRVFGKDDKTRKVIMQFAESKCDPPHYTLPPKTPVVGNKNNNGDLLHGEDPFWRDKPKPDKSDREGTRDDLHISAAAVAEVCNKKGKIYEAPNQQPFFEPYHDIAELVSRDVAWFAPKVLFGNTIRSLINLTEIPKEKKPKRALKNLNYAEPTWETRYDRECPKNHELCKLAHPPGTPFTAVDDEQEMEKEKEKAKDAGSKKEKKKKGGTQRKRNKKQQ